MVDWKSKIRISEERIDEKNPYDRKWKERIISKQKSVKH